MKLQLFTRFTWRIAACGILALVADSSGGRAADAAVAAKDESAQELLDGAISLYANCTSYTAKISSRQVFVSPAIPLFSTSAWMTINFRRMIYQGLTVRSRRDGSWLVKGSLISDDNPATSKPKLSGAQSYALSDNAGKQGTLSYIWGTEPATVSQLDKKTFTQELSTRVVGRGSFVLEPLTASAGTYKPALFPQARSRSIWCPTLGPVSRSTTRWPSSATDLTGEWQPRFEVVSSASAPAESR